MKKKITLISLLIMIVFSTYCFATLSLERSSVTGLIPSKLKNTGSLVLLSSHITQTQLNRTTISGNLNLSSTNEALPLRISEVRPYPNPMSLQQNGHLYYSLNKNTSLKCLVFDRFGRKVLDKQFLEGKEGGKIGVNKIPINQAFFNNYPISSGVYFVIIMKNNNILKRTKIAIIP